MEPDETNEETAIREAYEETGAVIHNPMRIGCYVLASQSDSGISRRLAPVYIARAISIGTPPDGSESLGTKLASLNRMPEVYYMWDSLIEAVFRYAYEMAQLQGWLE